MQALLSLGNSVGIYNDSETLPAEYLSSIYDKISASEIKKEGGGKDSNTAAAGKEAMLMDRKKKQLLSNMDLFSDRQESHGVRLSREAQLHHGH